MVGPKIPISEDQINMLVAAFYERVGANLILGPVFDHATGTSEPAWLAHEAGIASFWRNAIGLDRSFLGNPTLKHLGNFEIVSEQFVVWLGLFRKTAQDVLSHDAAEGISTLADRIGNSLKMGLIQFRQESGKPPRLAKADSRA